MQPSSLLCVECQTQIKTFVMFACKSDYGYVGYEYNQYSWNSDYDILIYVMLIKQ